jgi:hypothetical protein
MGIIVIASLSMDNKLIFRRTTDRSLDRFAESA